MAAKITEKRINRAEELIEHLLHAALASRPAFARGHADATWNLRPSAWRPKSIPKILRNIRNNELKWELSFPDIATPKAAAKRYLGNNSDLSLHRTKELVVQLRAEISLVQRFCSECDRAALPVPGHTSKGSPISIVEHRWVNDDGSQIITPYVALGPAFAFAQHYLIPTRLLDFSDDPFKAAYFAVPPGFSAKEFAVWLVRDDHRDPSSPAYFDDVQVIRALRSQIPYLHAQDGLFLACNVSSNRYFLENGVWPTVDRLLSGYSVEKIVCPAAISKRVRKLLDRLGINSTTMMPSYDTVSRGLHTTYIK